MGISLWLPADFTWDDQHLPVKTPLPGGHRTEPRDLQTISFALRDNDQADAQDSSGPGDYAVDHAWVQEGPGELAAPQEPDLELQLPLPLPDQDIATAEDALADAMPEGKAGKFVGGMFGMAIHAPKHIRSYRVQAWARVEGGKEVCPRGQGHPNCWSVPQEANPNHWWRIRTRTWSPAGAPSCTTVCFKAHRWAS